MRSVLFVLTLLTSTLQAQTSETYVGESCDLSVLGATEKQSFLQFDRDLRHALKNNDQVALSLLIRYSVRVNLGFGASAFLNETALFGDRYDEIFSPELRSRVLANDTEQTFCNWDGISYGAGDLWVNRDDQGYAIRTVNTSNRTPDREMIVFTCRTGQRRAVVTRQDDEQGFRYRSWPSAERLAEQPSVDLTSGVRRREGTGSCGHWIWSFDAPEGGIEMSEIGCTTEGDDARGRLSIQSGTGKALVEDCI